jgi:branched-chain amino acid transport system permease protein
MTVQLVIEMTINGVMLATSMMLVGLGFTLLHSILRVVNLAHGDLMILSAYLALALVQAVGFHPYMTLIAVTPAMFIVGYFIQRCVLNRVLGKGMEPPLIVAFGLSIILQNLLLLVFSPDARSLSTGLTAKSFAITGSVNVPATYLVGFLAGSVVILLLQVFFSRTSLGRAIRAASDDEEAAQFEFEFGRETFPDSIVGGQGK